MLVSKKARPVSRKPTVRMPEFRQTLHGPRYDMISAMAVNMALEHYTAMAAAHPKFVLHAYLNSGIFRSGIWSHALTAYIYLAKETLWYPQAMDAIRINCFRNDMWVYTERVDMLFKKMAYMTCSAGTLLSEMQVAMVMTDCDLRVLRQDHIDTFLMIEQLCLDEGVPLEEDPSRFYAEWCAASDGHASGLVNRVDTMKNSPSQNCMAEFARMRITQWRALRIMAAPPLSLHREIARSLFQLEPQVTSSRTACDKMRQAMSLSKLMAQTFYGAGGQIAQFLDPAERNKLCEAFADEHEIVLAFRTITAEVARTRHLINSMMVVPGLRLVNEDLAHGGLQLAYGGLQLAYEVGAKMGRSKADMDFLIARAAQHPHHHFTFGVKALLDELKFCHQQNVKSMRSIVTHRMASISKAKSKFDLKKMVGLLGVDFEDASRMLASEVCWKWIHLEWHLLVEFTPEARAAEVAFNEFVTLHPPLAWKTMHARHK